MKGKKLESDTKQNGNKEVQNNTLNNGKIHRWNKINNVYCKILEIASS